MPVVKNINYQIVNASGATVRVPISQHLVEVANGATVNFRTNADTTPPTIAGVTITKSVIANNFIPGGGVLVTDEVVTPTPAIDGTETEFEFVLADAPLDAGSLSLKTTVSASEAARGTDAAGDGLLVGAGIEAALGDTTAPRVTYREGRVKVKFTNPPDVSTTIKATYVRASGAAYVPA
jgi:hypothetical protein